MNIFVLQNTFVKVYIFQFSMNIYIKIKSQSYVLKTVSPLNGTQEYQTIWNGTTTREEST
jgi:hypothetical protein